MDKPAAAPLEVRNLTKRYSAHTGVRDVSFSIRGGEILGLLGPNGAGKSTIVKTITGMAEPSSGMVLFRGTPIREDPAAYQRAFGGDVRGVRTLCAPRPSDWRVFERHAATHCADGGHSA